MPGYYARSSGNDLTNTLLPQVPPPDTPLIEIEHFPEEELEELLDLFDYGTPLWGALLKTGQDTPVYPIVFAGIAVVAGIALIGVMLADRKKRRQA